jgi:hypothetical protein
VGAHHFPPGLEGALLTLAADGYTVEVLILPEVAEVDRVTGMLISIREAESDQYYVGPTSLVLSPATGSEGAVPAAGYDGSSPADGSAGSAVVLEATQRADLMGDREVRHIFRQAGSYVMTISFQPGDEVLAVEVPIEVRGTGGPSVLWLGVVVAVFVGAIFAVGLLKKVSGDG